MSQQVIPLRIGILDSDSITVSILKSVLDNTPGIDDVALFQRPSEVIDALVRDEINSLLLNIFNVGITTSLELIESSRKGHPFVPICLLGDRKRLIELPDVPKAWKKRFDHYFRLPTDQPPDQLKKAIDQTVLLLDDYLGNSKAYVGLKDVRNMLAHRSGLFTDIPIEQAKDIEKKLARAEKVLEKQTSGRSYLIQGFESEDIKKLVEGTLERAATSLQETARVNKWLLLFGMLLVGGSFVVATVTSNWGAMAFGGFGMAGIIASLITNPLNSISVGSRRLIQLHIAYVGFLKQLELMDILSQDHQQITVLEKSRQLSEATELILKSLNEHFG